MSAIEKDMYQAIVRGMRWEFERELIAGIKAIRLEASEWARLEPVD